MYFHLYRLNTLLLVSTKLSVTKDTSVVLLCDFRYIFTAHFVVYSISIPQENKLYSKKSYES